MNNQSEIAVAFAAALDAEDYAAAERLLAGDCRYDAPQGEIIGPAEIIASYRRSGDAAHRVFDEVDFRHEIGAEADGGCTIRYLDYVTLAGTTHTHRCEQVVRSVDGKIVHIVHQDIPGERESLRAFVRSATAEE